MKRMQQTLRLLSKDPENRHGDAAELIRDISQGDANTPEVAEPAAIQVTPESPTPETDLETPTPEKNLKTPKRPKADLETSSFREPSRRIVATVKSEQITGPEESTTKKAKSKRKEQEKS
jgi:hypothetical protein